MWSSLRLVTRVLESWEWRHGQPTPPWTSALSPQYSGWRSDSTPNVISFTLYLRCRNWQVTGLYVGAKHAVSPDHWSGIKWKADIFHHNPPQSPSTSETSQVANSQMIAYTFILAALASLGAALPYYAKHHDSVTYYNACILACNTEHHANIMANEFHTDRWSHVTSLGGLRRISGEFA